MNPVAGEVALSVGGERRVMRLTLGALAGLEAELGAGSLSDLAARFDAGDVSAGDILAVLRAGLAGGGHAVDPGTAEIEGGLPAAARAAARLLARAFAPL